MLPRGFRAAGGYEPADEVDSRALRETFPRSCLHGQAPSSSETLASPKAPFRVAIALGGSGGLSSSASERWTDEPRLIEKRDSPGPPDGGLASILRRRPPLSVTRARRARSFLGVFYEPGASHLDGMDVEVAPISRHDPDPEDRDRHDVPGKCIPNRTPG
jgi:hypothetical protein